jgi:6-phosphofructokinase 1
VVGIRRGWDGLLQLDPDEPSTLTNGTIELNRQNTRTIDRTDGTFLHTSHVDPSRIAQNHLPNFLRQRADLTRSVDR